MSKVTDLISIESIEQLFQDPLAVLLKHSIRCPISFSAKNEFDMFVSSCKQELSFYVVDVIAQRHVSNAIAEKCSIQHKSPQVLIFVNGTVVWNESHYAITNEALHEAVDNAAGNVSG
ncbi:bacillithiol system redox-active protein YtxJ [Candidatus Latescibacterota bacterium]